MEDRVVSEDIYPNTENNTATYSASNSISANSKITTGSKIEYNAGNSIELLPGFEVETGAEFSAYIGECDLSTTSSLKSAKIENNESYNMYNETIIDSIEKSDIFSLMVYPDPFTEYVSFKYYIEEKSHVTIKIFDCNGTLVSVIVDNDLREIGWYNDNFGKSNLSPGIYLYSIMIGEKSKAGKIIKNKI
ncbi:MAG: T9SS type A sorting domain-containing protein [Paludibacter sp.]|nr:T9SS type A sorting domain-containing protein [Paludibacter sp.]